ncbi:MAG TPA: hypothetical protein VGG02_06960 [Chthoniobacterales bacterium]|jgi:hypothetical protein
MASSSHFRFPISLFETESNLILQAAESDTYSAAINERLDDGTVVNGRTLWNTLFKPDDPTIPPPPVEPPIGSSAAQVADESAIGTYTQTQRAALKIYRPLAHKAREAAAKAFRGNDVKLHQEFRIGVKRSSIISKIVSEGRLLLAGVRNPANTAALKTSGGYVAKDTDLLEAALNDVDASETSQEDSKGTAKGSTDRRNQNLADLDDIIAAIQGAASNEYSDRESLSAFRIGIFPPHEKSGGSGGGVTPPGNNPPAPPTQ